MKCISSRCACFGAADLHLEAARTYGMLKPLARPNPSVAGNDTCAIRCRLQCVRKLDKRASACTTRQTRGRRTCVFLGSPGMMLNLSLHLAQLCLCALPLPVAARLTMHADQLIAMRLCQRAAGCLVLSIQISWFTVKSCCAQCRRDAANVRPSSSRGWSELTKTSMHILSVVYCRVQWPGWLQDACPSGMQADRACYTGGEFRMRDVNASKSISKYIRHAHLSRAFLA